MAGSSAEHGARDARDPDAPAGAAEPPHPEDNVQGMLGESGTFLRMLTEVRTLARSDAPVLIDGETGTGKELAARAVHYLSARMARPFVPVNCGALPESLLESELFGHARGAFTDARAARSGLITHAEGGTLFLDEVDALPAKGQVALLRFLQDQRYRPLGQSAELVSTARILAASNRSLDHEVRCGRFRSDLLYRLNILRLHVPSLRERGDDVLLLARHFASGYSLRYGLPARPFAASARAWLQGHDWPGNVRELDSTVHRMVLQSPGSELQHPDHPVEASAARSLPDFHSAKAEAIACFERGYLTRLLAEAGGNVSAAARMACTDRRALGRLLKKHGVNREEYAKL